MSRIRIFGLPPEQVGRVLSAGGEPQLAQVVPAGSPADPTGAMSRSLEQPGHSIGRYKLLQVLGEGGMGVVYLAEQTEPVRRQVALKIIKPGMDSKRVVARFEAEQQALAMMEHPHIARVYDAGLAPSGRPYFVMEYVKGIPITEHCDKYRLTIEERLRLFLHVCEAVQHAHQKGVIHRDLKPSNILVIVQDKEVIPKVIDFGVARAISQPLTERTLFTEQGQLIGTPEYMSPEQADLSNKDIDTRTDVYSLGVVLYELLAGVLPFDAKTFRTGGIEHIRKVICEEDAKTPSTRLSQTSVEESTEAARRRRTDIRTLQRKLRGDLDWITLKAVEKDRTRRYPTVDALATDIRLSLSHQPVVAAPPGVVYRARKYMRRHRQAAAAAGVALALLIIVFWAMHVYVQAGKERKHATDLEHERILARAEDLVGEGRFSDAADVIKPLLSDTRVGRPAQLLSAKILLNQQNLEMAVSRLEQLLGTADEVAGQAHMLLASIYYEGDPRTPGRTDRYYEQYKHHCREAESLIAGTADYYFLRAQGMYDVQAALHLLDKALELDSQHYESLHQRACIHYAQRDYESVLLDAQAMTTIRPNGPLGHNLKAIAFREMGRYGDALQEHNRGVTLNPNQAQYYDERRKTYVRMHQYEMALGDARKCVELEPDNSSYSHKLFAAYTAVGQYDQADQLYRSHTRLMAGYQFTGINPIYIFWALSFKLVLDSLGTGCAWHGEIPPPHRKPFSHLYAADEFHARLSSKAKRVIPRGFHPSWSPDGRKLVYTQGMFLGSVLAVLDLETGRTELLVAPGNSPEWSPDGQYIAFVKTQRLLPLSRLSALTVRDMVMVPLAPQHASEVWVMDWDTRDVDYVAEGEGPHWGRKSGLLYYSKGHTLYAVSPRKGSVSRVVRSDCLGDHPVISPNEQYVAEVRYPELQIIARETGEMLASWTLPPLAVVWESSLHWSADSRIVMIGNLMSSDMGLWAYDLDVHTASRILHGCVAMATRSPDGRQSAISLGVPFLETWIAAVAPDQPMTQALGAAMTAREHCLETMESCSRHLETDPDSLYDHLLRTAAALWIRDDQANAYLQEMDDVLDRTSDPDGECSEYARATISRLSPERGQLLPLAGLLARRAVRREPATARLFAWMLRRSGYPEQASALLQMPPDTPLGSSRYDIATDTHTISAIGADIWETFDDFHFAHKRLQGNGSITARIDSIENANEWTKAGVMIRSTLEPGSPHAMMLMTPGGRLSFQYRHRDAEPASAISTPPNSIQPPHWVRLVRQDYRFTAQDSNDGVTWQDVLDSSDQPVIIEIPMDEMVYIGLAVTSHDINKTAGARISHVTTTGNVSPAGPFTESRDIPSQLPASSQ
jgi:serine/threonine protein kinase/tetratricopeptide (TPR) repeat protein